MSNATFAPAGAFPERTSSPASLPRPGGSDIGTLSRSLLRYEIRRPTLPPGPPGAGFDTAVRVQRRPVELLRPLYHEYGPVFSMRIAGRPTVIAIGPDAARAINVQNPTAFSWRQGDFGVLTLVLGDSLITTDGAVHDRTRKLIMPGFHRRQISDSVDIMLAEATQGSAAWQSGATVDIYQWMRHAALRVSMRALLGLDPEAGGVGRDAAGLFESALSFFGRSFVYHLLPGPHTPRAKVRREVEALGHIVAGQIEERERNGIDGRSDILSTLLVAEDEDGRRLTVDEIRDHLVTLMFGGHDTSSSTLSLLLYELARRPDLQGKLYEEQEANELTPDTLADGLPLLSACMDEALRLYPPVWISPRLTVEEVDVCGHVLPPETNVMLTSYVSHRLPEYFDAPDEFHPERFAPEARGRLTPGAYFPFGGGPRICIGKRFGQMMVKAMASVIIAGHEFSLAPGFDLKLLTSPTLSPGNGVPLLLRERQ